MKKILNAILCGLLPAILFSQEISFEKNFVFEPEKVTGADQRATLIDFDSDGDNDILLGDGVNDFRFKLFKNNEGSFDDIEVIYNHGDTYEPFAVGDLDGDGDEDIVFTDGDFFFLENDNGTFLEAVSFASTSTIAVNSLSPLHIIDYDDDGNRDILYVDSDGEIGMMKNNGALSFSQASIVLGSSEVVQWLQPIDLEGDNDFDFVVFPRRSSPAIIVNNGDGTFTSNDFQDLVTGSENNGFNLQPADFNDDGYVDFASLRTDEAQVHLNNQDNTFTTITLESYTTTKPIGIYNFDYDGDNHEDVLVGVASQEQAFGFVYKNDGTGSFTRLNSTSIENAFMGNTIGTLSSSAFIRELFASDLDRDSDMDLVTFSIDDSDLIVHYQNADGTFDSDNHLNIGRLFQIFRTQAVDYDGDGDVDILSCRCDGTSETGNKALISINNDNESFIQEVILDNVRTTLRDVVITDWDQDGKQDLIYANGFEILIQLDVVVSNESDLFSLYQSPDIGSNIGSGQREVRENSLRLVDIDNDGDEDIAFLEDAASTGMFKWIENENSTSSPNTRTIISIVEEVTNSFSFGDLNGDDHLDFVWADNDETFTYLFDPSSKTFTLDQTKSNADGNLYSGTEENIQVVDVDTDGDNDIVYIPDGGAGIRWYENTDGQGILADEAILIDDITFNGVLTATDLNKDNRVDFIGYQFSNTNSQIETFLRTASGDYNRLSEVIESTLSGLQDDIVVADIDGNGILDILTSINERFDSKDDAEEVWLSTCFDTSSEIDREACGSFTAPSAAVFTESGVFQDIIPNQFNCDSVITINLTINPIFNETATAAICEGESYTFGSQTLTTAGDFTEVFQSQAGCDSTVVLSLAVNAVFNKTATASICEGESFTFGSQTLTTAGDFTEVFQSQAGCDSTVVLSLAVNAVFNETATATICEGESFEFGSQTLTTAGDFTEVFQSQAGCDSTVVLSLAVNTVFNETTAASICEGESFEFGTQTLTTAGDFTELFQSQSGCDSTVVLSLAVSAVFNETATATICEGESFEFGTQTLTTAGDFTEVFQSQAGCDSTVVLSLAVNAVFNEEAIGSICEGESFTFGTQTLTTAGDFTEVFQSQTGCDSTVVLSLAVNTVFNETTTASICEGESFEFGTQTLTTAGDFTELFQSQSGCDSTVVLSLAVSAVFNETATATICEGEFFEFGTQTLTTAGDFTEVFQSQSGCDSTVVLSLAVSAVFNETATATICEGEFFEFGTQTLTTAGDFTEVFQSQAGCDSTVVLSLAVNAVFNETATASICEGESFTFGKQTLMTAGDFTEVFQSQSGCDSTVVLSLSVNTVFSETATASICEGESFTFGAQTLTTAGDFTEVFQSQSGCDSTVVLSLSVNTAFNETATASICEGESFTFGTQTLTTAGDFTELFQSQSGCDSSVVLSLSVNSNFNETATASICEGESFVFGAQTLTTEGDFTEVFQSEAGCDSTVVLTLGFNLEGECVTLSARSEISSVRLWPNPFGEKISIDLREPTDCKLIIYDLSGNMLLENDFTKSETIEVVPSLSAGVYVLELRKHDITILLEKIIRR